ncbi:hypothetical protein LJ737_18925 [Hymenobacter sp. 15J16-1T3B]|uniref:hypothetical protein n=1 Tax=Hymenobacter sp. 15J16-1T3B TaxID=2886941 RepID=UPI001D11420F|nr:hypothetical protein [Hymenobacter sp. 15J16-1T3B]MCC3159323.1 hypothetical protein [Hymenobacter sp. 15J16-1T3B]
MKLLPLLLCAPALAATLTACTLTSTDVEPTPPQEPVSGQATVSYRLDGQPVVANNYSNLGDIFLLAVPLLNRKFPVEATVWEDSTLVLAAIDAQRPTEESQPTPQQVRHDLVLRVPGFHGVGTYTSFEASFAEQRRDARQQWQSGPELLAAPGAPQRLTVTEWTPDRREVRGTFELVLLDGGSGQRRVVSDGWFFALTRY